ncbi:hypothetical protein HU200_027201 [Digitaria exilis]|uniref:Uncharacterized protein n=1 Tax=Digitaria exilis TaxID=1010633 RepID=A0A835C290_9POAL|nr:hypothetical protein HU200_027201 [Digitaria exilis]
MGLLLICFQPLFSPHLAIQLCYSQFTCLFVGA